MADQTNIEWADSTFNPWIGCTKISPACDHCYAEAMMDKRMGRVQWGAGKPRQRTSAANWRKPAQWNAKPFYQCRDCGWRGDDPIPRAAGGGPAECPRCESVMIEKDRRRVFCASLADVFDNEVDPIWRRDLFRLIDATPNLDWLLLTKRIGNARNMSQHAMGMIGAIHKPLPPNVWLGATICNQEEADRDIPKLLAVPAAVRFLSIEPMLGPIDLTWVDRSDGILVTKMEPIDWIIVGGESGPHARPMRPDWVRSLRDQGAAAGVPFLFKQWGEWAPNWLNDDAGQKIPGSEWIDRMGKKAAGRSLDGVTHNGFPAHAGELIGGTEQ